MLLHPTQELQPTPNPARFTPTARSSLSLGAPNLVALKDLLARDLGAELSLDCRVKEGLNVGARTPDTVLQSDHRRRWVDPWWVSHACRKASREVRIAVEQPIEDAGSLTAHDLVNLAFCLAVLGRQRSQIDVEGDVDQSAPGAIVGLPYLRRLVEAEDRNADWRVFEGLAVERAGGTSVSAG